MDQELLVTQAVSRVREEFREKRREMEREFDARMAEAVCLAAVQYVIPIPLVEVRSPLYYFLSLLPGTRFRHQDEQEDRYSYASKDSARAGDAREGGGGGRGRGGK